MKEFEAQQQDNVQQSALIDKMVQKLVLEEPQLAASEEYAIEASKKVQNVISYLITRENVLMISQLILAFFASSIINNTFAGSSTSTWYCSVGRQHGLVQQ